MRKTKAVVAVCVVTWSFTSLAGAQAPCRAIEIDRLGAREAYVYDLNNWDQVVGALATTPEGQASQVQPFVWEHGRTRLLESPSQVSEARAINAFGRSVGAMWEASGARGSATFVSSRCELREVDRVLGRCTLQLR